MKHTIYEELLAEKLNLNLFKLLKLTTIYREYRRQKKKKKINDTTREQIEKSRLWNILKDN